MSSFSLDNSAHFIVNELRVSKDFQNYTILGTLGEGTYGLVCLARRESDGKLLALKFFGYSKKTPDIIFINDEIMKMTSLLGVSGIIQLESIMYDSMEGFLPNKRDKCIYPVIAMEMINEGDLLSQVISRVEKKESVSEESIAKTFHHVLDAVAGLHERGFIHCDLKVENILLLTEDKKCPLRIIDFGHMYQFSGGDSVLQTRMSRGTMCYLAPESTDEIRSYSTKSDIWQLGCILYILLCGHAPFHAAHPIEDIRGGNYIRGTASYESLSPAARDLISKFFIVNPHDRPNISDIRGHEWMKTAPCHNLEGDYSQRVRAAALRRQLRRIFMSSQPSIDVTMSEINTEALRLIDDEENAVARRFFNQFDKDKNGLISKDELMEGIVMLFNTSSDGGEAAKICPIVRHNIDEIFNLMDLNGDGNIEFKEFVSFYAEVMVTSVIPFVNAKRNLSETDSLEEECGRRKIVKISEI